MTADTYTSDLIRLFESDMRGGSEIILANIDRMKDMAAVVAVLRDADDRSGLISIEYSTVAVSFLDHAADAVSKLADGFHNGKPDLPAFTEAMYELAAKTRAEFEHLSERTKDIRSAVAETLEERAKQAAEAQEALDRAGGLQLSKPKKRRNGNGNGGGEKSPEEASGSGGGDATEGSTGTIPTGPADVL